MATVPPFGAAATAAPFASTSEAPFEFKPEKHPGARWLSWSTLVLIVACGAGYFQYERMQQTRAASPTTITPPAASGEKNTGASATSSIATPFTALKQAKATIQDAGDKHKAAYELVEKMLDDPNAATDAIAKPAPPAPAPSVAPSEPVASKRDAVQALLGSDGEFVVPADSPKPSLRFARWVRAVKIGGARLNDRPRVLVGPSAFTFGDVVDIDLGVVLDGYNAVRRALRFREMSTGAVIERRL